MVTATARPWGRTALRRQVLRLAAASVAVVAALAATAVPANAFGGAFFPTQSRGNRGVDVVALQYLLQQSGRNVAADGVFGSGTESSVKSFQTGKNLTSDGIVGPNTWGALAVTVRQGSDGPAVRAL